MDGSIRAEMKLGHAQCQSIHFYKYHPYLLYIFNTHLTRSKSRAQREKEEKQREEELAAQMQREAEMAAAAAAADPPEFDPPTDPALLKMVEEVTESIMPLPSTKDQVVALAM